MLFVYDELPDLGAKIKVIGVGGAGGNAINRMIGSNMKGVEFVAVNTDAQALNSNKAEIKLQIGRELTHGKGAGANPEKGKQAAVESQDAILQAIDGADLVFITCGMGGGTGTGASPIIAETAKNTGALVVGIITRPFNFEGKTRSKNADIGVEELRDHVDTLIVVQNQKLLEIVGQDTNLEDAFLTADSILNQATKGISDLIIKDGLINLDLADVKTIMTNMGDAIMGIGTASGPSRGIMAASLAISSPLLDDVSIQGAKGVLINFTGGKNMKLSEVSEAAEIIHQEAGEDANIIFGTVVDESMSDEIQITVIATGFNSKNKSTNALPSIPIPQKINNEIPMQNHMTKEKHSDFSIPTFLRNENVPSTPDQNQQDPIMTNTQLNFTDIDYDAPAYLRRQTTVLK